MKPHRALLTFAVAGLVLAGVAGADGTQLNGSVGPGFGISLKDGSGNDISKLDAGTYTLVVDDKSNEHNFHLQGPGVNVSTGIDEVGQKTFSITVVNGTYTFICDAHASLMAGTFTVGTASTGGGGSTGGGTGGGGTGGGGSSGGGTVTKLVLTVTASGTSLTTPAGKKVTTLPAGTVSITVRDKSPGRGVRLVGAGAKKATTAKFVGTVTWRVPLSSGTLVYAGTPAGGGGKVKVS